MIFDEQNAHAVNLIHRETFMRPSLD
jgi:hypothetical protein